MTLCSVRWSLGYIYLVVNNDTINILANATFQGSPYHQISSYPSFNHLSSGDNSLIFVTLSHSLNCALFFELCLFWKLWSEFQILKDVCDPPKLITMLKDDFLKPSRKKTSDYMLSYMKLSKKIFSSYWCTETSVSYDLT